MTTFDSCIAMLEADGSPETAWLRLEPVFHEADSHYQIRGNRDGLLLFAAAAIRAGQEERGRVNTAALFTEASVDDQYILYLTHGDEEHGPAKSSRSRARLIGDAFGVSVWALVAACAVIGMWQIITSIVR